MTIDFINLASGIVWAGFLPPPHRFVRIQSTACEQKRWSQIIEDLDYSFLVPLAMGLPCAVWDGSSRKPQSRAIYQGLPWIEYVLNRELYDLVLTPWVKGHNVADYFDTQHALLSEAAKKKLRYVRKFASGDPIRIEGHCRITDLDGKYEQLNEALRLAA